MKVHGIAPHSGVVVVAGVMAKDIMHRTHRLHMPSARAFSEHVVLGAVTAVATGGTRRAGSDVSGICTPSSLLLGFGLGFTRHPEQSTYHFG